MRQGESLRKIRYPGEMPESFTFADLFAGIGGMRIPFDEFGGTCVFTSEIDKHAQKTYQFNFPSEGHLMVGDITEIAESDVPNHDILLAGFPCQPFSNAGHRKGLDDVRGTLFFDIARILREKQPKAFLLENVRGLVGHDEGKTFRRIIEILDEDYHVSYKLLNARDFGLAQNRLRVYITGFKKDDFESAFDFESVTNADTEISVGSILEKSVESSLTLTDGLWEGHQRRKAKHLKAGNGFGYRIVDGDSAYTPTLSARYFKDGSEILVSQQGLNPRKLSPREGARLQGFPENFELHESKMQAFRQLGNAVPINVVRAIAEQMVKRLITEVRCLPPKLVPEDQPRLEPA